MRPIVHPRMLERLETSFFPSTVTIQTTTEARGTDGSVINTWANLASHIDLPCNVVPETTASSREVRRDSMTVQKSTHRINLAGHYSSITERMQAVTGGVSYDVLLVVHDSQETQTTLIVEQVKV